MEASCVLTIQVQGGARGDDLEEQAVARRAEQITAWLATGVALLGARAVTCAPICGSMSIPHAHEMETAMTAIFVNLPVTDLERAKTFDTALGFTINPDFTDENAACVVIDEEHAYLMILVREFFQTFTERPVGDPSATVSATTALFVDSRAEVDAVLEHGLAAGGTERQPAADYGFMYQRQLSDPDGNVLEFGYMDPAAAVGGPDAAETSAGA